MANFCKFCGTPLENGVCTCEAFKQANAAVEPQAAPQSPYQQAAPQQTPYQQAAPQQSPYQQAAPQQSPYQQAAPQQMPYQQAAPQQMPYQPAQPAQPAQPNPTVEKLKKVVIACKDLLVATLKAPTEAIRTTDANADKIPAFVVGGVHIFLLFVLSWISFLGLNDYIGGGVRAKIGLVFCMIAILGVLFATLASLLLGKKYDPAMNFVRALANVCVATIPGTLLFVLYFIFGLFAPGVAIGILALIFVVWIILSQEVVNVCSKGAAIAPWVNTAAIAITMILVYLIGKAMIMDALSGLLRFF